MDRNEGEGKNTAAIGIDGYVHDREDGVARFTGFEGGIEYRTDQNILLILSYLSKVTLFLCDSKWIPTERYVILLFLIYNIKTYLIYFNSYDKIKTFY